MPKSPESGPSPEENAPADNPKAWGAMSWEEKKQHREAVLGKKTVITLPDLPKSGVAVADKAEKTGEAQEETPLPAKDYFEKRLKDATQALAEQKDMLEAAKKRKDKKGVEDAEKEIKGHKEFSVEKFQRILKALSKGNSEPAEKEARARLARVESDIRSKELNAENLEKLKKSRGYLADAKDRDSLLSVIKGLETPASDNVLDATESKPDEEKDTTVKASETKIEKEEELPPLESPEPSNEDLFPEPKTEKKEEIPVLPKEIMLTPEQVAEKEFKKMHSEEREKEIIENRIQQKLNDPDFVEKCKKNIANRIMARADLIGDIDDRGSFAVKGVFGIRGAAKLDIMDVAGLLASGMTPDKIREIKISLFGQIRIPRKGSISEEAFDKMIEKGLEMEIRKIATEEANNEWNKRKTQWLEQATLSAKAKEAEIQAVTAERKKQKAEVEKEQGLEELKDVWGQAQEIDEILRSKPRKYKYTTSDGEILTGKKALETRKEILSTQAVKIADRISGEKLMQKSADEAGYKLGDRANKEGQREFQRNLTHCIENILIKNNLIEKKPDQANSEENKEIISNELSSSWQEFAKRQSKIKEIDKAMAAGDYRIKGEKLKPENAKQKMEEFRAGLVEKNGELFNIMVDVASELSGRNLRKEAREESGYNKRIKKDREQKRAEFLKLLFRKVKEVLPAKVVLENSANVETLGLDDKDEIG